MPRRVKLGIWGGNGGEPRDIGDDHPSRLSRIQIYSNHVINAIAFEYYQDGRPIPAGPWGGSGGSLTKIEFQPGEYLTEINGTDDTFADVPKLLRSLTFVTNVRTLGPFGDGTRGTPFSIQVESGRIVAFHGRSGDYLDALGIYLLPN